MPTTTTDPFLAPTGTPAPDTLVVGLPVTYCIGSDQYAMLLVEVRKNGREVVAAEPASIKRYEAETDAEYKAYLGRHIYRAFTRRGHGGYVEKGSTCGALYFGRMHDYRDPSF